MSANNVTGGRAARLCVCDGLAFAYQDSGMLGALMDGNLDAPTSIPAGSHIAQRQHAARGRNATGPLLHGRTGGAP